MAQFYRGTTPDGEAYELAEPSTSSVFTEQPQALDSKQPSTSSVTTDHPQTQALERPPSPFIPPIYYFAVQLTHNLICRLIITDCRETNNRHKAPLRNNNHDIIFYEEDEFDESVSPDLNDKGPEVPISKLDPEFFARILKKALEGLHKDSVPRKNIVLTYPGRYHHQRETGLLHSIRGLQLFQNVCVLPESSVYHELFYKGQTAENYQGEVPCVLYAHMEESWFSARPRDHTYVDENRKPICSGYALAMAGIEIFNRMRTSPDTGPRQRELLVPFESLVMNHFELSERDLDSLGLLAPTDKKKTAGLALVMDPDECFVSKKAYQKLRSNVVQIIMESFGKEEPHNIRIICVGKMFSMRYKKFKFYADVEIHTVKWQKCKTNSLHDIPAASTCLAALHDGIDILKLEASECVTRPIHRNDLSFELSTPIPSGDIEY